MLSNQMTGLMGQILPYMELSDQPLGPLSHLDSDSSLWLCWDDKGTKLSSSTRVKVFTEVFAWDDVRIDVIFRAVQ